METSEQNFINTLPKDVMILLGMELSIPTLINLCKANKVWNKNVCDNETFWMKRFQRDFPNISKDHNLSYKQEYEHNMKISKFAKYIRVPQELVISDVSIVKSDEDYYDEGLLNLILTVKLSDGLTDERNNKKEGNNKESLVSKFSLYKSGIMDQLEYEWKGQKIVCSKEWYRQCVRYDRVYDKFLLSIFDLSIKDLLEILSIFGFKK